MSEERNKYTEELMVDGIPMSDLIACAHCDALHQRVVPEVGQRARCTRCGHVLINHRRNALRRVAVLNLSSFVLFVVAIFVPFITIGAVGIENTTSVFQTVVVLAADDMLSLSLLTAGAILIAPFVRMLAMIYALMPVVLGYSRGKYAFSAFRLSEKLRPWAMAEIFMLGVAVALIKVAGIAVVTFGPAFWLFAVLVGLYVFSEYETDRWTILRTLNQAARNG